MAKSKCQECYFFREKESTMASVKNKQIMGQNFLILTVLANLRNCMANPICNSGSIQLLQCGSLLIFRVHILMVGIMPHISANPLSNFNCMLLTFHNYLLPLILTQL